MSESTPDPRAIAMEIGHALELQQRGDLDRAGAAYDSILKRVPGHPDALHFYGLLLCQRAELQPDPARAAADVARGKGLLEQAVAIAPDYADALNNLGNVYLQTGELEKGERALRAALAARPSFAHPCHNLGVLMKQLGRFEEALELLERAARLDPDDGHVYQLIGETLRRLARFEQAARAFSVAIERAPSPASFRDAFRTLRQLERNDEADRVLDRWLAFAPEDPIAQHMRAATRGSDTPSRASDGYVRTTFDGFAPTFDEVLASVGYAGPELVAAAFEKIEQPRFARVVDAGCGTGLCGPALRARTGRLVGIDISPGMIARAKQRGVYDELLVRELTAALAEMKGEVDVITCADTLVYFGDLAPVFAAASGALVGGGHLVFTVEKLEAGAGDDGRPATFRLNAHGRYAHDPGYVSRTLSEARLEIVRSVESRLRMEHGAPVMALVVTARRAPGGRAE